MATNINYTVGVDIGGSHISSVLVDVNSGNMLKVSLAEMNLSEESNRISKIKWINSVLQQMQM